MRLLPLLFVAAILLVPATAPASAASADAAQATKKTAMDASSAPKHKAMHKKKEKVEYMRAAPM